MTIVQLPSNKRISGVLRILRLIDPEDLLRLAQGQEKVLKMAAGAELESSSVSVPLSPEEGGQEEQKDAEILSFPEKVFHENDNLILFEERKKWKLTELKREQVQGLGRYKEMGASRLFSVKTIEDNGNEKIKIVSGQGVLVDKKME